MKIPVLTTEDAWYEVLISKILLKSIRSINSVLLKQPINVSMIQTYMVVTGNLDILEGLRYPRFW